jgi:tRNA pseudouridine55 synthase
LLGILLVHKEVGRTSHDVVDAVRRTFKTRRVGHAGTLDPLATGLLVVAVGPATRFLQYLPLEPKEYVATIAFGRATSTYDLEGESTFEGPVPDDLAGSLENALPKFKGLISQLPPMYSAVKVDGKPLYHYARQGKMMDREPRTVHIDVFDYQILNQSTIRARIVCSGGTYIRSLAHDLGEAMGCGAHLTALERTRVGRFGLEDAQTLDALDTSKLIPLSEALLPMPILELDEDAVHQIREGRQVGLDTVPEQPVVALAEPSGQVFSVARVQGHVLQPECVIPSEAMSGAA